MPTAASVETVEAESVTSVAPATIDTTSDQKWIHPRNRGLLTAYACRAESPLLTPTRLRGRRFVAM
ncbi:hypothetical protein GCM10009854_03780 [Saccharopolyspora halophila]|uniref:Uncharacterized protein n=1 Tax=Saccharopolyspora halophila TaxID=405551 RepID=A0ABP5SIC7_9PSEU